MCILSKKGNLKPFQKTFWDIKFVKTFDELVECYKLDVSLFFFQFFSGLDCNLMLQTSRLPNLWLEKFEHHSWISELKLTICYNTNRIKFHTRIFRKCIQSIESLPIMIMFNSNFTIENSTLFIVIERIIKISVCNTYYVSCMYPHWITLIPRL